MKELLCFAVGIGFGVLIGADVVGSMYQNLKQDAVNNNVAKWVATTNGEVKFIWIAPTNIVKNTN